MDTQCADINNWAPDQHVLLYYVGNEGDGGVIGENDDNYYEIM